MPGQETDIDIIGSYTSIHIYMFGRARKIDRHWLADFFGRVVLSDHSRGSRVFWLADLTLSFYSLELGSKTCRQAENGIDGMNE